MTQEEKQLLSKVLCARSPYGVKVAYLATTYNIQYVDVKFDVVKLEGMPHAIDIGYIKPYLRPMSSMTEEERKEFSKLLDKRYCEEDWEGHICTSYCIEIDNVYTDDKDGIKYPSVFSMDAIDWLDEYYFDYRGLIPMGLALEALEDMYKTK